MRLIPFIIILPIIISISYAQPTAQQQEQQQEEEKARGDTLRNLARDLAILHNILQAEDTPRGWGIMTTRRTPVRAGASENAPVLFQADERQRYDVLDKVGDWYAITTHHELVGSTPIRSGWLHASAALLTPTESYMVGPNIRAFSGGDWASWTQDYILKKIQEGIEYASDIRERYKTDSYISIDGFSATVGVLPAITINFKFK